MRYSLSHLADHVLGRTLRDIHAREAGLTADMLAHLAEFDTRRLYLAAAYPTLHAWCMRELNLSEDAAYKRIQAARAARRFPAIFTSVAERRLHLCGVVLLAPHLTPENSEELIAAAAGKSKREIEVLLVERFPQPAFPGMVRSPAESDARVSFAPGQPGADTNALSAPSHETHESLAPGQVNPPVAPLRVEPAVVHTAHTRVTPIAPERYTLQVTIAGTTHDKLRYAQSLLGHAVPDGDMAQVLDRALDALIARLEQRRFAKAARSGSPRASKRARTIPAAIRCEVWARDAGRCTFEAPDGRRCESRSRLEFDHVRPLAKGGETTAGNLRLLCRAHNQHAARQVLGAGFMQHKRDEARQRGEARREARLAGPIGSARSHESDAATRERAAADRLAREAAAARAMEIMPWLRELGLRAEQARRAAEASDAPADAPLAERVKQALRHVGPRGVRRENARHPCANLSD